MKILSQHISDIQNAVQQYRQDHNQESPFPQVPFSNPHYVSRIYQYLPIGFPVSDEKIRELWINRLNPNIRSTQILDKDRDQISNLVVNNPDKGWPWIAKAFYDLSGQENYYPASTIQEFAITMSLKKSRKRKVDVLSKKNFVPHSPLNNNASMMVQSGQAEYSEGGFQHVKPNIKYFHFSENKISLLIDELQKAHP